MKKKLILLLLIASILLIFSCQRNEGATSRTVSSAENSQIAVSSIQNPGFALVVNTGFYTLAGADDGEETTKMKWTTSLSLGDDVMTGNTRRLTLDSNNRVYNVIEVRRTNGTEGYSLANQVVPGGRLAVVIDERANLHRTPRPVDVTGTILSRRSVIVYYPETESNGFVEVRGYDIARNAFVDSNVSFVRLSTLSRRDSDIQSSIMLQTAMPLVAANQAIQREALLKSALDEYPDSVFYEEIYELAFPKTTSVIFEEGY